MKKKKSQDVQPTTLFRLKPELVPTTLWGKSVYKAIGKTKAWEDIRTLTKEKSNAKCEVCGDSKSVKYFCHEKWDYADKSHLAVLIGFGWICQLCNQSIHFGRTNQLAQKYPNLRKDVISHMMRVNNATRDQVEQMISHQQALWSQRSGFDWNFVVSDIVMRDFPSVKLSD